MFRTFRANWKKQSSIERRGSLLLLCIYRHSILSYSITCCEERQKRWNRERKAVTCDIGHVYLLFLQHWGHTISSFPTSLCQKNKPLTYHRLGVQNVHRPGGSQGHAIWCPAAGRPRDKPDPPPGAGASSGQGHQICVGRTSANAGVHGLCPRDLPGWATLCPYPFYLCYRHPIVLVFSGCILALWSVSVCILMQCPLKVIFFCLSLNFSLFTC